MSRCRKANIAECLALLSCLIFAAAGTACAQTAPVMAIAGTGNITTAGSSTYDIPIVMPPGTSGMQPTSLLRYNSSSPTGLAGPGWSSEFVAIKRCTAAAGIFCLSANQLVAIKGAYGADGSEYRQKRDDFTRVIAHGNVNGGPEWFETETKAGLTEEYGRTADARQTADGQTSTWMLNRVTDAAGNYYTLQYRADAQTGRLYPLRYDYSGNEKAELKPYDSVRFVYGAEAPQRLTGIQMFTGDSMALAYRLDYETGADGIRRLNRLSWCDGHGVCMAPTLFQWREFETADGGRKTLLSQVDNGLGNITAFAYGPPPKPATASKYYPDIIATAKDVSNGNGGLFRSTYSFGGDPVYFDDGYIWGFSNIATSDPVLHRVFTTIYSTTPDTLYAALGQTTVYAGVTTKILTSEYGTRSLYPGVVFYYERTHSESNKDLDGTAMPGSVRQSEYDDYGNMLRQTTRWPGGGSEVVRHTYWTDIPHWYLDRLLTISTTRLPSAPDIATRTASFQYAADTGLLTQEVIEPDVPQYREPVDYTYDVFGHRIVKTSSYPDLPSVTEKLSYDAKGLFLASSSDATGRSEHFTYEPVFGQIQDKTDFQGATEHWTYDGFGRLVQHAGANGAKTQIRYAYCQGINNGMAQCPQFGVTLKDETGGGADPAAHILTYYNARGLQIAVQRQSGGNSVTTDTRQYDADARISQECQPPKPGSPLECTNFLRDDMGRQIHQTKPGGEWTWAYHGFTTVRTDKNGGTITNVADGMGHPASETVKDAKGERTTRTSYDMWGNLLRSEDALGRVTEYAYDVRGRRIKATGPDGRTVNYRYNSLGEIIPEAAPSH